MGKIKKILILFLVFLFYNCKAFSANAWINDLRSVFLSNNAIIYAINIRTFNAKDKNKNGIIEEWLGEEKGNFINAIDRLDELKFSQINTVLLLPVTPVGKTKALGTAGSLYAASAFNELNPQLKSSSNNLSINDEMKKFVEECHNRNIRVIVDLPSCGAYDLYLNRPDLFMKDENQNPIIPADWTDVRLFDAGTEEMINTEVYTLYSEFIDLMLDLNIDGVRATVASIKPYSFWKQLIEKTRIREPQFLFLAESSKDIKLPPSNCTIFTPLNKLLEAGFDGYHGGYSDLKDWKTAKALYNAVEFDIKQSKKSQGNTSVIGDFATHDQISPILINGKQYSKMIVWLNTTLPLNSYYIDGFATGDEYIYPWANKKAVKTYTDDDYYFVHRGQLDIFNFSRSLYGKHPDILMDYIMANKFKSIAKDIISKGDFTTFRTSSPSIFAYARTYNEETIIVIGNLDFKKTQNAIINVPKINKNSEPIPIKLANIPKISNGKIKTILAPGEIIVFYFKSLKLK